MARGVRERSEYLARTIRVSRKLWGVSQQDLAEQVGVAQSQISKFEANCTTPSATCWYQIGRRLNLELNFSYQTGCVDRGGKVNDDYYKLSTFTIPQKYTSDRMIAMRSIYPLVMAAQSILGKKFAAVAKKKFKIDPDFVYTMDHWVGPEFLRDLLELLSEILPDKHGLEEVAVSSACEFGNEDSGVHGVLVDDYKKASHPTEVLALLKKEAQLFLNVECYSSQTDDLTEKFTVPMRSLPSQTFERDHLRFVEVFAKESIKSYISKNQQGISPKVTFERDLTKEEFNVCIQVA